MVRESMRSLEARIAKLKESLRTGDSRQNPFVLSELKVAIKQYVGKKCQK